MLIVEADITARDRRIELPAGVTHTLNGVHKLIIDLRIIRITEIQTIGDTQRLTAAADDIPRSLRHGDHRSFIGIRKHIPAITIRRHRQRLSSTFC